MGGVLLKAVKLVGESHWIFLGLSMAGYALERYGPVRSNVSYCNELLINVLEKLVHLAKNVEKLGEAIPHDTERLCYAIKVIVEGTLQYCDCIAQVSFTKLASPFSCHINLIRVLTFDLVCLAVYGRFQNISSTDT